VVAAGGEEDAGGPSEVPVAGFTAVTPGFTATLASDPSDTRKTRVQMPRSSAGFGASRIVPNGRVERTVSRRATSGDFVLSSATAAS
jgi:hypothetical protein